VQVFDGAAVAGRRWWRVGIGPATGKVNDRDGFAARDPEYVTMKVDYLCAIELNGNSAAHERQDQVCGGQRG